MIPTPYARRQRARPATTYRRIDDQCYDVLHKGVLIGRAQRMDDGRWHGQSPDGRRVVGESRGEVAERLRGRPR